MMELTGKIFSVSRDFMTRQPMITFLVNENLNGIESFNDKDLKIKVSRMTKPRSLDANAYAWVLISRIADVLRASKEEIYFQMLKKYGQSEIVSVLAHIDVSGYFKYYEAIGTAELQGKQFTHYKVFKGSSEFDSHEMSILIDGIVSDAQDLGIETRSPDEIKKMEMLWDIKQQMKGERNEHS